MPNDIAIIERSFAPYVPAFAEVLGPLGMRPERIIRTVLIACEKNPKLIQATRPSLISSAMTGAVLGLEMDGWSGQGFIVPFAGVAQFQMGYKGYPTIGARSQTTVKGESVRERDEFDYSDGSKPFVHFRKKNASRQDRGKIVGAWAVYSAEDRPPYVTFMGIDDLLDIKARSPAVKAGARDTPWNDVGGPGFETMCAKTAVRAGGRFCPIIGIQRATAIEDQQDMGNATYLRPDGALVIEGQISPFPATQPASDKPPVDLTSRPQPGAFWTRPSLAVRNMTEFAQAVAKAPSKALFQKLLQDNDTGLKDLRASDPAAYNALVGEINQRKEQLMDQGT